MKSLHDVLKRPIITERTTDMMAEKKYVFEVPLKANKTEIKQVVEKIFGVKVAAVNTIRVPAKPKRYGKYSGYTSEWKKAIVKLTDDSKDLTFYEGV
ncbi:MULTISPECIES: 50S ribosomal protein L23 [Brevibacillus]|uniref:Large ribosomal subunit protein uL23 n=1 Tax=Brevibacillus invocatus TaxID=173959 RepID=A0A3M8C4V0_9BACL|nr:MULTISPECIES: 50S ribosomal protein L23 [Brevibacillus]MCM3080878.1 50S ribosomal protein L23 [Brevibacillus invocatus]MCM3431065.1 50S ribosomal protein L23 [Brevibacillus invocatus]MDH4618845.1 50S ribosomal protein L23 [Brevibacillus sp. AY1]RNB70696.1 50S ribosomal protein L23 [Brevibacillus invocatus]